MNITIDENIKNITNDFYIGVLECNVLVYNELTVGEIINELEDDIMNNIKINDVINLENIIDGRNAYKKYGKDPSRYRLAVESLYRRISKGNKLYRINNIVDIGNIISIKTKKSVAVLDYFKIQGDIKIRLGLKSDEFYGIGRGRINIDSVPLYEDSIGPFGSTTSDTERTMITNETSKILLFIISFSGIQNLEKELDEAINLYRKYGKGSKFSKYIL